MILKRARSSVVEHHVDIVGVVGSIPTVPTKKNNYLLFFLLNYIKDRINNEKTK